MKRFITTKLFLSALLAMVFVSSCDNDFAELNLDPDGATSTTPGQLFSKALISSSRVDMEPRTNYFHGFMQYGFNGFLVWYQLQPQRWYFSRYFNSMYTQPIKNITYLIMNLRMTRRQPIQWQRQGSGRYFCFKN